MIRELFIPVSDFFRLIFSSGQVIHSSVEFVVFFDKSDVHSRWRINGQSSSPGVRVNGQSPMQSGFSFSRLVNKIWWSSSCCYQLHFLDEIKTLASTSPFSPVLNGILYFGNVHHLERERWEGSVTPPPPLLLLSEMTNIPCWPEPRQFSMETNDTSIHLD